MTVTHYYNKVDRTTDTLGTRALAEKLRATGQCQCFGYAYIIRRDDGLYKIGMTQTLRSRMTAIRAGLVSDVDIVRVIPTLEPRILEKRLQSAVRAQCVRGEWFRLDADHLERLAAMCDEEASPLHESACIDAGLSSLSGEIMDPEDGGRWELATIAHTLLGVSQKTLYRRIERGLIKTRKNGLGRLEVWLSPEVTPATPMTMAPAVPDTLTLAIVNELRQQREADRQAIVTQAETIAALSERAARAEADAAAAERERRRADDLVDTLIALRASLSSKEREAAELKERLATAEWRWWHRFTKR